MSKQGKTPLETGISETSLKPVRRKSRISVPLSLTVKLSEQDMNRLKEVAERKYRIPQNLSHTIRLLIEDAFMEVERVRTKVG